MRRYRVVLQTAARHGQKGTYLIAGIDCAGQLDGVGWIRWKKVAVVGEGVFRHETMSFWRVVRRGWSRREEVTGEVMRLEGGKRSGLGRDTDRQPRSGRWYRRFIRESGGL